MRVHYLRLQPIEKGRESRDTVGGTPIVAAQQDWPVCKLCKSPLVFFVQLDIQKAFDLPLKSKSHLLVFMCPVHNDVPTPLAPDDEEDRLPERFWEKTSGHYLLALNRPGKEQHLPPEPNLAPARLRFKEAEEDIEWDGLREIGSAGFKVGGVPHWAGEAKNLRCSCGGEMVFVLQVPPRFSFAKQEEAPAQKEALAPDRYCLFLGHRTFIFACKEQCSPLAVHAITQEEPEEMAETA